MEIGLMGWLLVILRLPRTGYVLGRAGMLAEIAKTGLLPDWARRLFYLINLAIANRQSRHQPGEALCKALTQLGPGFVKFGQALATRADLIGPEMAKSLTSLQDKMPAFSAAKAKEIIQEETGQSSDQIFSAFQEHAVAAASIAQVHKAELPNGQAVAVKILRPHIHHLVQRDFQFFLGMAKLVEWIAPALKRLKLVKAVEQFAQLSEMELDLRLEAAGAGKLAEKLANDPGIRVPKIYLEHTTKCMLVMEWIDGVRIDDVAALHTAGHNIEQITEVAATSFFNQVFRDGFFHGDMHPGNIFVTADGTLVPIDFGIMGHLDFTDRLFLAQLLKSLLERDYDRVARLHQQAGMLPADIELAVFSQNLRAVADPILGKSLGDISLGLVLGQILQISARFHIDVQPQFNLLQKTMIMAEGVARTLNPNTDMWELAEPLAANWLAQEHTLKKQAEDLVEQLLTTVKTLPAILEKMADTRPETPQKKNLSAFAIGCGIGLGLAVGSTVLLAILPLIP